MKHQQTKVKWNQSLRFGTISHILASTDLNCCTKKEDVLSDEALIEKNAVEIVKQMQRLKGIDGDYDSDSAASNRLAQRHTIQVDKDLIFPICAQHICSVSSEQPFFFSYLNWNLPRTSSGIDKRKEQLEPLMLPSRNDSLLSQVLLSLNLNFCVQSEVVECYCSPKPFLPFRRGGRAWRPSWRNAKAAQYQS